MLSVAEIQVKGLLRSEGKAHDSIVGLRESGHDVPITAICFYLPRKEIFPELQLELKIVAHRLPLIQTTSTEATCLIRECGYTCSRKPTINKKEKGESREITQGRCLPASRSLTSLSRAP